MPKREMVIGLLLLLLAAAGPAAAEETPTIDVLVADGSVTVDARDAPLADVLRTIGDRAHVTVTLKGDLGTRVTRSFVSSSVEDAVRRLVRGHSTVWTYAPSAAATGAPQLIHLAVIGSAASVPADRFNIQERAARLRAIRGLGRRRDAGATSELVSLSRDPDPVVRSEAVSTLALRGDADAIAALETALGDEVPSVRMLALRGLRRAHGEAATPSIARTLRSDADPRVRSTAAHLLQGLRSDEARRALEGAASDADAAVRRAAALALAGWRRQPR